jgi:hypothetical protein
MAGAADGALINTMLGIHALEETKRLLPSRGVRADIQSRLSSMLRRSQPHLHR